MQGRIDFEHGLLDGVVDFYYLDLHAAFPKDVVP